jgi:hypothetical protein
MWAVVDGSRLFPTSENSHQLLQDPMVLQWITGQGVIGGLYLVGAMK